MRKKKVVLLGIMSTIPVAGNQWLVAQYVVGLSRLGYDVYYVEAHGRSPRSFLRPDDEHGTRGVCEFLAAFMKRFDMGHRWAYHALYADGNCYGLSETQLKDVYRTADLLINLHGATTPLPEHSATGRLVYLETDPVQAELEIENGDQQRSAILAAHNAFFTWGVNYGSPDCGVPLPPGIDFQPTLPPVVLDFWQIAPSSPRDVFTTVGNWRQRGRDVRCNGILYRWSKHHEFLKFIDLPKRTQQPLELALSGVTYTAEDQRLLESNGWRLRDALEFSWDMDAYRDYITSSRGEFTVAKDQNIRLRSGWFSERSAQYLAAGRPVITQHTGFSNVLPTGEGLFGFFDVEDISTALETVNADYEKHSRAAIALARNFFHYDVVLERMLAHVGV